MELVASPLTFSHTKAVTKRRFACSPIVDSSTGAMDCVTSSDYNNMMDEGPSHSFKRRRFNLADDIVTAPSSSDFSSSSQSPSNCINPDTSRRVDIGSPMMSRCNRQDETDNSSSQSAQYWRLLVDRQSTELESLKSEKSCLEASFIELKTHHERVVSENKILKKAVNIQQDRQHQAIAELDAARKYKDDAEQRIRMLEQIIISLRFHLQAQEPCGGNDFMNFSPRPPDVF